MTYKAKRGWRDGPELDPVELSYLSDRARAHTLGLEGLVRELRLQNTKLLEEKRNPRPLTEGEARTFYEQGWEDARKRFEAALAQTQDIAERALKVTAESELSAWDRAWKC